MPSYDVIKSSFVELNLVDWGSTEFQLQTQFYSCEVGKLCHYLRHPRL